MTYRTVSIGTQGSIRAEGSFRAEAGVETAEFEAFITALRRLYPAVHAGLELERVNGHALLYRWPGTAPAEDPAAAQRASVLMAHYDVVPAGDAGEWTHAPFSGYNDGTFLWGRGTLDDKGQLVAILEAAEGLLGRGMPPRMTSTSRSATTRRQPATARRLPQICWPAAG